MPDTNGQPVDQNGLAIERRRPGRREVDPVLIPLLRRPAGDGRLREDDVALRTAEPALSPGRDPLGAARGVAMSLMISLPFWGLVEMVNLALRH